MNTSANVFGTRLLSHPALPWLALALAFGLASFESFHPLVAALKLASAGCVLAAIGRAVAQRLDLERGGLLIAARDVLLGQLAALTYVYARSLLCDSIGLPGITQLEAFLAAGLLLGLGRAPAGAADRPTRPAWAFAAGLALLWLAWLGWIALAKLDLHFTPSSDPDIHAFYAKLFLERGHVYYDLLPYSDSWMVYPSAFASLNFVWGTFSGLHAVQLVNIAAHLQWTLLVGAVFGWLAWRSAPGWHAIVQAIAGFGFAFLAFNAVFVDGRAFLEGTPRLAHTALLLHPLLFTIEQRRVLLVRSGPWGVPILATALSACVNPTHVPAVLLVAGACLIVARPPGPRLRLAGIALGIALAVAWTDPFYRELLLQRAGADAQEAATDLTGAAITGAIDFARVASHGLPDAWARIAGDGATGQLARAARVALALAALLALFFAVRRLRDERSESDGWPRDTAWFYTLLFGVVGIHGLWTVLTPALARPGVLQTRLLIQYSRALQEQLETMLFAFVPLLLWSAWISSRSRVRAGRAIGAAAIVTPCLLALTLLQHASHREALRTSPLGMVHPVDVEFVREVARVVPRKERVLLPGRSRRLPGEHWVFTTDAGRAVPLFSGTRTSFFLGLDGWAFTGEAYEAHVAPVLDPTWLRAHETLWLLDSGQLPARQLRRHYEVALRGENAVLWRLRERSASDPDAPATR